MRVWPARAHALREVAAFFFHRSAVACPPRSLDCADDGEGNPLGCAYGIRGPSPYDEGAAFFYRSAGACPPRSLDCADDGEGPPPTMKGGFLPLLPR